MSFTRNNCATPGQQLANIATAYRLAGVQPPTVAGQAIDLVNNEPGANAVAGQLAVAAYNATDAEAYLEDALTRIARAQAADILRPVVGRAFEGVVRQSMRQTLAQAAADLAPAFTRTADKLGKAASKLDPAKPLDERNAIRDDTSKELKAARLALAELGIFAGMYDNGAARSVPPALAKVLPVLALPDCVMELTAQSFAAAPPVINLE